jgi:light-regulated signal transduction histidine kinase (bacteriophytochrome)
LEEVVELLAPPSNVHVQIDNNMPSFVTHRILLQQVFSNLVSNAIKHNDKQKPLIKVGCTKIPAGYEFFVEDNGPGIAKEHHDKIFVIFQTLQSRDKFESTGVGLTIVKRIIEEQGGSIHLESTVGKGSKFIFTWTPQTEPEHTVH